jgi:hypothetical protein
MDVAVPEPRQGVLSGGIDVRYPPTQWPELTDGGDPLATNEDIERVGEGAARRIEDLDMLQQKLAAVGRSRRLLRGETDADAGCKDGHDQLSGSRHAESHRYL